MSITLAFDPSEKRVRPDEVNVCPMIVVVPQHDWRSDENVVASWFLCERANALAIADAHIEDGISVRFKSV